MQPMMKSQQKTMNRQPAPPRRPPQKPVHGTAYSSLALLIVAAIAAGKNLPAQTHALHAAGTLQQQETTARPTPPRGAAVGVEARPAPEARVAPPPDPIWPANQPLHEATITWENRGLEIDANNSSLVQILHQVLSQTGTAIQGLAQDQRMFGTYGPGPVGEVLSKLLDDSGYNVLMIGGRETNIPREIVLTVRAAFRPAMAESNRARGFPDDDEADPPSETPPAPQMVTPFGNGDSGKPETPQQIMQDILSRQQKIDQLSQQKDQQQNPQP
jgi:hypothetical protein